MERASLRQPERPLWMEIDPAALAHNLAYVRRLAGKRRLIASVKANAYGHGAVEFARRLETLGIDTLWTGSIAEAIALREAGVKARILLFAGYLPAEIPQLLARGFVPTIYDREGALAVNRAAHSPAPIYVKVDSGLGRLGVPLPEAESHREMAPPNIQIEGVYSHLPGRCRWPRLGTGALSRLRAFWSARQWASPAVTRSSQSACWRKCPTSANVVWGTCCTGCRL
jgi:alanine racemase